MSVGLPAAITIREVGPRDGLQAESPVPPASRVRLIHALEAAGLPEIEVASFVSPRAVPAMAGAGDVVAALDPAHPRTRRWVLVPNVRGAELALTAGVDYVTVTISASEAYSAKNVHMTIAESLNQASAIAAIVAKTDVVVSCAFGSPYEGDLPVEAVAAIGRASLDAGAARVTYADTTGMATPRRVAELVAVTGPTIGMHFHETRGTGLVNAYAAMQCGVTRFDTSIGGLGGSPFADGAAGNLATEDLVYLCGDVGVDTGIDLATLLGASALVAELVGHAVPSRVAAAGPRGHKASDAVV